MKPRPKLNARPTTLGGDLPRIPDRKISETILDFGSPILDQLGPTVSVGEFKSAIQIILTVWNAGALAMPIWGTRDHLSAVERIVADGHTPAPLRAIIVHLHDRRRTQFGDDPRAVGDWEIAPDGADGFRFRCDARLPQEVLRRLNAQ